MKQFLTKIFLLFIIIYFMLYDRTMKAISTINETSNVDISGKFFICIFIALSLFLFLKTLLEEIYIKKNRNYLNSIIQLIYKKLKLNNNKEMNIDLMEYYQFKDNDNNEKNV